MIEPLNLKNISQILFQEDIDSKYAVEEKHFFALDSVAANSPGTFPICPNANKICRAKLGGDNIIVSMSNEKLYLIGEVLNFGFGLCRYIFDSTKGHLRLFSDFPFKKIISFKEDFSMGLDLSTVLQNAGTYNQYANSDGGTAPENSTPNQAPTAENAAPTSGGVQSYQNKQLMIKSAQMFAQGHGYVTGYIVKTGPIKTLRYKKKPDSTKSPQKSAEFLPVETRPSTPVAVAMSLPKGILFKEDGSLAGPTDFINGNFAFDQHGTELVHFVNKVDTAISIIGAIGDRIPEYAPTHTAKGGQHPSASGIISGKESVSYVTLKTVHRNDTTKFSLATTEKKRGLFTTKNFFPLKLARHVSTTFKDNATMDEIIAFNKMVLSPFTYVKDSNTTDEMKILTIQRECPNLLYKHVILSKDAEGKEVEAGREYICPWFIPKTVSLNVEMTKTESDPNGTTSISTSVEKDYAVALNAPQYVPFHSTAAVPLKEIAYVYQVPRKNGTGLTAPKKLFINYFDVADKTKGDFEALRKNVTDPAQANLLPTYEDLTMFNAYKGMLDILKTTYGIGSTAELKAKVANTAYSDGKKKDEAKTRKAFQEFLASNSVNSAILSDFAVMQRELIQADLQNSAR